MASEPLGSSTPSIFNLTISRRLPGQCIPPHIRPQGQDSFVILSGVGSYQIDRRSRHDDSCEGSGCYRGAAREGARAVQLSFRTAGAHPFDIHRLSC